MIVNTFLAENLLHFTITFNKYQQTKDAND